MRTTSTPMCDAKDCNEKAVAQIDNKDHYLCYKHLDNYQHEIYTDGGYPKDYIKMLTSCGKRSKCLYNNQLEQNGLCYNCPMQSPMPPRFSVYETVDHPSHYTEHPSGIECIAITEHMGFCLGNAIKYIWRADSKGGIEDLEKARWYITREIERKKKGG